MNAMQTDREESSTIETDGMIRVLGSGVERTFAGGKGAALDLLIRHDLPVPEGFVIAAEALSTARDHHHPPTSLLDAVMEKIAEMDLRSVAIRSSAVDEDGSTLSFAGQYTSVLSVAGDDRDAVTEAISRVWKSLFSDHATAYRETRGEGDAPPTGIAVVVQKMVDADSAGVLFSVDPVSGDRSSMVINVVRGLGEKLVSGEVTPEEIRIARNGAVTGATEESLLQPETLEKLRDLALQIEEIAGGPQDIEFAISGGRVSILQARPITTLAPAAGSAYDSGSDRLDDVEPVPIALDIPEEGFWELSSKDFQRPVTPLTTDLYYPAGIASMKNFCEEFGILLDGMVIHDIGGHPYVRVIPPGGKDGPTPPAFIMKLLFRLVPALRAKRKVARQVLEENRVQKSVDRWFETDRPSMVERFESFRSRDLACCSDNELLALLDEMRGWVREAFDSHFRTIPSHYLSIFDLYHFVEEHLGWPTEKVGHLISGISDETSNGVRLIDRMSRLATEALGRPPSDVDELESLARGNAAFEGLYREFIEHHGLVIRSYDLDSITEGESRTMVLQQVVDTARSGYDGEKVAAAIDARREELWREAEESIATGQKEELRQIRAALDVGMPIRDDTGLFILRSMGAVRMVALELGRRLAERSLIERREHIFYLKIAEIVEGVRSGREWHDLIRRRRGERKWAEMNPGPRSYGKNPGDPPPMEVLPPALRRITGGMIWLMERDSPPDVPADEEGGINGVAASAGIATGRIRVIHDTAEFGSLEPGDILVCAVTTPAWAGVFPVIGGVITDFGGILSHPAILAREFGVPAVVGTGSATSVLKDGDLVRVDGGTGRVEILEGGI